MDFVAAVLARLLLWLTIRWRMLIALRYSRRLHLFVMDPLPAMRHPLIPLLLLSDGPLAAGLLAAVARRCHVDTALSMALDATPGPAAAQQAAISAALGQLDPERRGVLVLVEQEGARSANLALALLDRHRLAIVTGLNAPMLQGVLEARLTDPPLDLEGLAEAAGHTGRAGISRVSA